MLFFRFIFLVSTSAACKCFHKTTTTSPRRDATEAACYEAGGKMRYYSGGGFDCNAHTMSNKLRKFSIWCSVYGSCSDCHCPHGCSNMCPKDGTMFGDDVRNGMEDDDGDVWVTDNGENTGSGDAGKESKLWTVAWISLAAADIMNSENASDCCRINHSLSCYAAHLFRLAANQQHGCSRHEWMSFVVT
ncbi:hypothetical protein PMIN01_08276 [Paraphaeosphaeria minitans]|uniref:Secreted protein n=1 Tax=Paraphaeosphaeria minitans TaxID=565426 RepID=A0A9P6GF48_9PLEO|nr:hypothetical protein PMIN01_08276 [Paraphaeosphaeria minitans]